MKLWQIILPYKFTPIKPKKGLFQNKNRLYTGIVISRNNEIIRKYKKVVDQDKDSEDVPK